MNAFRQVVGGAMMALTLAAALAAPAMAQSNKKDPPPTTTSTADIDFGDDSSPWANDGECDDPRFYGAGSAVELLGEDMLKDATDCRAALAAGTVAFDEAISTSPTPGSIDWGDDTSSWANDGECDDPRFTGTGMAAELFDVDIGKDATDCRAAYENGTITLKEDGTAPDDLTVASPVDFGDDSSEWANDGECDDPRFTGTGTADELVEADLGKDATDCRTAYDAGTISYVGGDVPVADIDYGDDTSQWANDGECDDPRFSGTGVAGELLEADRGHDASDCRAAVVAGTATFNGETPAVADLPVFDYGSDWSKWAYDGECDDLRFEGEGTDKKLLTDDLYGDATDCRTLEEAGRVTIRKVYTPAYAAGAPYDSSHIDFGDNASNYADDDRCDDPRFEGPGAASVLLESDERHDAADCRAAYEAGTVLLSSEAG